MADVVDLELVRRERSDDAHDWSVVDALKEAIKRIESGDWKPSMACIAMIEETDSGRRFLWTAAGCSNLEMIGLLHAHAAYQSLGR